MNEDYEFIEKGKSDHIYAIAMLFTFLLIAFVSYKMGQDSTANKIINIIDTEMSVTTDQISLENIRLQIQSLRK